MNNQHQLRRHTRNLGIRRPLLLNRMTFSQNLVSRAFVHGDHFKEFVVYRGDHDGSHGDCGRGQGKGQRHDLRERNGQSSGQCIDVGGCVEEASSTGLRQSL